MESVSDATQTIEQGFGTLKALKGNIIDLKGRHNRHERGQNTLEVAETMEQIFDAGVVVEASGTLDQKSMAKSLLEDAANIFVNCTGYTQTKSTQKKKKSSSPAFSAAERDELDKIKASVASVQQFVQDTSGGEPGTDLVQAVLRMQELELKSVGVISKREAAAELVACQAKLRCKEAELLELQDLSGTRAASLMRALPQTAVSKMEKHGQLDAIEKIVNEKERLEKKVRGLELVKRSQEAKLIEQEEQLKQGKRAKDALKSLTDDLLNEGRSVYVGSDETHHMYRTLKPFHVPVSNKHGVVLTDSAAGIRVSVPGGAESLKVNDLVVSVAGEPVTGVGASAVMAMLEAAAEEVQVIVKRKGIIKQLKDQPVPVA